MGRFRLDQQLVARGLVATRSRARDLILRGKVCVGGKPVSKPGTLVSSAASIYVPEAAAAQVSRGAVKLEAGLAEFKFEARDRVCLDVGASTGGFTQILLERGASQVYCVDVGRDQLHQSLRDDPRVTSFEGTDARALTNDQIRRPVDAIVADVSFISLTLALEPVLPFAAKNAWLLGLIKPQFEAGRDAIGKGGIVREQTDRQQAVSKVRDWLGGKVGWRIFDVVPSPITGTGGNEEFLIGAVLTGSVSTGSVSTDCDTTKTGAKRRSWS